jgi:hypothetical protein
MGIALLKFVVSEFPKLVLFAAPAAALRPQEILARQMPCTERNPGQPELRSKVY